MEPVAAVGRVGAVGVTLHADVHGRDVVRGAVLLHLVHGECHLRQDFFAAYGEDRGVFAELDGTEGANAAVKAQFQHDIRAATVELRRNGGVYVACGEGKGVRVRAIR